MARRLNRNGLAVTIIALSAVTLAGLGIYAGSTKPAPHAEKTAASANKPKPTVEVEVKPDDERDQVTTLTPKYVGDDLKFDQQSSTPPAGVDPKVWAVNQYLGTLQAVPKDAKLLSCKVEDLTATLDFNQAIMAGYGTTDEGALVNGVLTVMGQFKDIQAVKFTVEGQPIESFGNIDLSEAQPVLKMPKN